MRSITEQFHHTISKAKAESQRPGSFGYLPGIIRSLENMLLTLNDLPDKAKRSRMASAVGRLVSEDFQFSEGPLGTEILELVDDYAELQ